MNMMVSEPNTRRQTALTDEIIDALNKQVQIEDESSQYYLACASWCHKEGYEGAAHFFYKHAEEERAHMLKIFNYINDAGGHALAADIKVKQHKFDSLKSMFDGVLDHEIMVTESINKLTDHAFSAKDFGTFQFLLWFVEEQREEEEVARRAVELFELIGEAGQGKWMIDQEIKKLAE